jgi:Fic family protein
MDKNMFKNANGEILNITNNSKKYSVFIPNNLPVKINYNEEIIKKIELANNYLGKLSGLINNLPNPDLFLQPYLKREAVLSSRIEGTRSSLSDVFKADLEKKHLDNDLKEVLNYIKALEFGLENVNKNKLSVKLLLTLNKILLTDVRGHNQDTGKIRNIQNWIGKPYSNLETSLYNPPNPEKVYELLNNLVDYINLEDNTSILIKSAIVHYQFEAIHPFIDGNGRVGRLLIILYLYISKLLDKPILYLSEYFEKNKEQYYFHILNVSTNSDYNSWFKYFLDGVIEQSLKTIERVNKLLKYRIETRTYLKKENVNMNVMRVFDYLFSNPYIDVIKGKKILEINNYTTSKRTILKLVELGILKEDKSKNKRYIAEEITKIILEI